MSERCKHRILEAFKDQLEVSLPEFEGEIAKIPLSNSTVTQNPITATGEVFVCTICVETDIAVLDRVLIPECNHSFCLDCLLSWATVRSFCPNCKTPFTSLLVHRCHEGEMLQGPWTQSMEPPWRLESVILLQGLSWVQLREVHTPQHDIENSFSLPLRSQSSIQSYSIEQSSSAAPHYFHEEVEDELEERFWQEEEKQYDRLMQRTRVISNRRFGPKGYIVAGHMQAKARPSPRTTKLGNSSGVGSSQAHMNVNQTCTPQKQSSYVGTRRKKKVKKKSRAGIAAAAAAAAAAAKVEVKDRPSQTPPLSATVSSTEIGARDVEEASGAM